MTLGDKMTREEYLERLNQTRKNNSRCSSKDESFSDYLENPDGKFVIAITKSQSVFYSKTYAIDHAYMVADIIKEIRPDLIIDGWGNTHNKDEDFREHNIIIFGYPGFSLLSIPSKEMLSPEQYKELEEILQNIKEYNEKKPFNRWELLVDAPIESNIESRNYEKDIDKLLMSLEDYTTKDYKAPEEEIIGKQISENKNLENKINTSL